MNKKYTLKQVAEMIGRSTEHLKRQVDEKRIELFEGKMIEEDVNNLLFESETYISLLDFATQHSNERFNGTSATHRNKLLDLLEENDFFDLEVIPTEDLVIGTKRDHVFFFKEDVDILEEKSKEFFSNFGISAEQQIYSFLENSDKRNTNKYIKKYLREKFYGKELTPSAVEFVQIALTAPDVLSLENHDLHKLLRTEMIDATKRLLIDFLNYVYKKQSVRYSKIEVQKKESHSHEAYSNETYLKLAKCFFDPEHIHKHNMIEKALNNHFHVEQWLYLVIFFTCGWRGKDVCDAWKYLELNEQKAGWFGLNLDTLYDDILHNRIREEIYEAVCEECLKSIRISERLPGKTEEKATIPLLSVIGEELKNFYGLLILIAESHMLRSGEGYMKSVRHSRYQNKVSLRDFFGDEIKDILHNRNILSMRLNKTFLQGVESTARKNGENGVRTSMLASYARNHISNETIKIYLKDHRFTGEDAGIVLYSMFERGVFGFEIYNALLTSYPEAIKSLSLEQQNKLMELMDASPMLIELNLKEIDVRETIRESFISGDEEGILRMLESMYNISQMKGKSKEVGVYCLRTSLGRACKFPTCESCIIQGCDEQVFTKYGLNTLWEVIKQYYLAGSSGNRRAQSILDEILIPRYQSILRKLKKNVNMSKVEVHMLGTMLEGYLNA